MSTTRSELSEKNTYYLEKYRFLELKNFCLQFPIWERAYESLTALSQKPESLEVFKTTGACADPTANCALARVYYSERIAMVVRCARAASDEILAPYLVKAVTEGLSYDALKTQTNVPCCRNVYYQMYRKFFWLLNKERN